MSRPTAPRPLRRAVAVGALLLTTALVGHAAAGGALPSAGALVVPAGLSLLVAAVLTSARPPRPTTLGLIGASQYAVHTLLVLSASRAGSGMSGMSGISGSVAAGQAAPPGWPCLPAHGHGAVVDCLPPDGTGGAWRATDWVSADVTMFASHVAATLATGLLLAQGDRLLGWLRAAARSRWRRRIGHVHPVRRPGRIAVAGCPVAARPVQVWVRLRPRRGPPRRHGIRHATT